MEEATKRRLRKQLSEAFNPSLPIERRDLFAGRLKQIRQLFSVLGQKGRHVVIYGQRGVGKTSLGRVMPELLTESKIDGIHVVTVNAEAKDSFERLWQRIFRELAEVTNGGFKEDLSDASLMHSSPDDIRYMLQRIDEQTLITIDEVDRIQDPQVITRLADAIKSISDHAVRSTLVLIGIADSVGQLIGDHKSIERNLEQVQMPYMTMEELSEIIEKGLNPIGMTIKDEAKRHIAALSQGLPYYTRQLTLCAGEHAADDGRLEIEMDDVKAGINLTVEKTDLTNLQRYLKATASTHPEALYQHVLLACAFVKTDELGFFLTGDLRSPLSQILGRQMAIPNYAKHLNEFCEQNRGTVLIRDGTKRRYKYRFAEPQMRPFVTMRGLTTKLIDAKLWGELSGMH